MLIEETEKMKYVKCYFIGSEEPIYIPLGDYIEMCSSRPSKESIIELTDEELYELEHKKNK